MSTRPDTFSVYGAGSWGTALALQLARNGIDVKLWGHRPSQLEQYNAARENTDYLSGIPFPDTLHCEQSLEALVDHSLYQLIVVPSHGFRALLEQLQPLLSSQHKILWATKGLELKTGKLLHELVEDILPQTSHYGLVSGPTFAAEVASGLPTAMTVAANDETLTQTVSAAFQSENYRVYTSDDIIGVELGGAVKNVLAIAAGITDGLGFGANARTALITRGLAEIMRLGTTLGAKAETLMGLAGIGDLILTCTDDQSRNRQLGLALGAGKTLEQAIEDIGQAVEGAKTSQSINLLAKRVDVEMPICTAVQQILYEGLPPQEAVRALISRKPKPEF
ncbi:NAD(P)H-dependent glycerol-3-phosphate dehydrogenase [Leucothrix pacifica]|uniref:Glycerol-3-phosphate dehydrogenase [NAD(P)+] n=1 Tax=Leucothrix pacifica TaxID=1247513 RepID=A0A317CNA1_9GAMM|nr:NAD(P)H-dependent glycerol-3-phosphate dehydrogenase [Leucothrix pacifica]PWR00005.1 glycerol-3-phosphate dehydrogenase [Leucothrix pacifica]